MYIFDNKHNKMFLLAIHRFYLTDGLSRNREVRSGAAVTNSSTTLTFIGHIPNTSTRVG